MTAPMTLFMVDAEQDLEMAQLATDSSDGETGNSSDQTPIGHCRKCRMVTAIASMVIAFTGMTIFIFKWLDAGHSPAEIKVGETVYVTGFAEAPASTGAESPPASGADTSMPMPMASSMEIFNSMSHGHEYFTPGFYHGPHHLLHDSMLYKEPSATSEVLGVKKKGTQLFPLKLRGNDWVQVIVPREQGDNVHATFGWMYVRNSDMHTLLKRDSKLKYQLPHPKPMQTKADINKVWEQAKAQNKILKQQLSKFQEIMKKNQEEAIESGELPKGSDLSKIPLVTPDAADKDLKLPEFPAMPKNVDADMDMAKLHEQLAKISKNFRGKFGKDPSAILKDLGSVMKSE